MYHDQHSINFRCHPEAVKFVSNYNRHKQLLLDKLFKLFNEKAFDSNLPANMAITWNPRLTKTAGVCVQVLLAKRASNNHSTINVDGVVST